MKKSLCAILVSLLAFSYAGDVSPTISLRVNDMLGGLEFASPVIGLKMSIADGVSSGFDAHTENDGTNTTISSRIYLERSYGRIGLGTYASTINASGLAAPDNGKPYFTIGTSYSAYANLDVDLEYVVNSLAAAGDKLQLSLTVGF